MQGVWNRGHLRLPEALKRLIAMDAFADLRFLYWATRGTPAGEPVFHRIAPLIRPDDVVVEVGASTGGGTLSLSSLARHVYAFEPNRQSYRILKHFTRNRDNVTAFNAAIGESGGVACLNLVAGEATSQASSIKRLEGVNYEGRQNVRVFSLDEIKFPLRPSVLIIDCEGYEAEVLRGGRRVLESARLAFVETHTTSGGGNVLAEVLSQLEEARFNTTVFSSDDNMEWVAGARDKAINIAQGLPPGRPRYSAVHGLVLA